MLIGQLYRYEKMAIVTIEEKEAHIKAVRAVRLVGIHMAEGRIAMDEVVAAADMAVAIAGDMMVEMAEERGTLGQDGSSKEVEAEDMEVEDGRIQQSMIAKTNKKEATTVASGHHRDMITIVQATEHHILDKIVNTAYCTCDMY